MKHINIIGAGIVGTLTAYFAAKEGYSVTVFEKERYAAMKCSHANGGQISVCNAQTWNTWGNVAKGLKWIAKKDAPLLIRPKPSLDKIKWLAGFMRHVVNNTHEANTIETIKIGLFSREAYKEIIANEDIKFHQLNTGLLHVYNEHDLEEALSYKSLFEDNGIEWQYKSRDEILALDKAMGSFANLSGGILTPSDWTGDIHLFCKELQKILQMKYNVEFKFDTEVLPKDLSADEITVICNGHNIMDFSKYFKDSLNVYPVKGYSVTINNVGDEAPSISLLDDNTKIVTSKLGNRFRIAGTAELSGENYDILYSRIKPLLTWCHTNFPNIDTRDFKSWACLRPMSSNMMPIIKQSKMKNVWYHGGHGHLGWTLGAGTAKQLMNQIK